MMPKYRPKFQELIAINYGGEWIWELPDGTQKTEYLDGSQHISFLDFFEEIPTDHEGKDQP